MTDFFYPDYQLNYNDFFLSAFNMHTVGHICHQYECKISCTEDCRNKSNHKQSNLKPSSQDQLVITQSHLDVDAFICLADAGDGGRRGLVGVGGGARVVGRIQKALLRPCDVRQATQ